MNNYRSFSEHLSSALDHDKKLRFTRSILQGIALGVFLFALFFSAVILGAILRIISS